MDAEIFVEDFLEHHGVKGMKWGVRKDRGPSGVSKKTNREAAKDAKEYTRAKMFYGDGAGTRRKLINNTVKSKSKDASYKKAFDYHVEKTDMAKRAGQARGERKRKNVVSGTAKTARGVKNILTGSRAPVTITALAVTAAATNPQVRDFVSKNAKVAVSTATKYVKSFR